MNTFRGTSTRRKSNKGEDTFFSRGSIDSSEEKKPRKMNLKLGYNPSTGKNYVPFKNFHHKIHFKTIEQMLVDQIPHPKLSPQRHMGSDAQNYQFQTNNESRRNIGSPGPVLHHDNSIQSIVSNQSILIGHAGFNSQRGKSPLRIDDDKQLQNIKKDKEQL